MTQTDLPICWKPDLSRLIDIIDRFHHTPPLGAIVYLVRVIFDTRIVDAPRMLEQNSPSIRMALDELHDVEVEVVYQYVGWYIVLGPGPGVMVIFQTRKVSSQPLFGGFLRIGPPGGDYKNFMMTDLFYALL